MPHRYYEEGLSGAEGEAFRALCRGLSSFDRQFSAPRLDTRRLGEIFSMVKLDCPEFFHVESLAFKYFENSSSVTVTPTYTMDRREYEATREIVKKRIKKVLAPAEGLSGVKLERFIHDYIVKSVRYDKLKKAYSHEVTGPLCHGIGVCEGISKTFKLLCDEAGIDCMVATGIGVPPESATGKKSERHAWNIVFLYGTAYGVDVTFDLSLSRDGKIKYYYFNAAEEVMSRCHSNPDFPLPRLKKEV